MIRFFEILLLFTVLVYFIQLSYYAIVLLFRRPGKVETELTPSLSVIVPFRNEQDVLKELVNDLRNQDFNGEFEVIFINDHSEDESVGILEKLTKDSTSEKVIGLDYGRVGKKEAISAGVEKAGNDWIVQTDADCRLDPGFLSAHASYATGEYDFVAGPVRISRGNGLLQAFDALDYLALSSVGMASFFTGHPLFCSGANMAFSKAFFMEANKEFLRSPGLSGDDVFLMLLAKKNKRPMTYLENASACVTTSPVTSLKQLFIQRARWGSKARISKEPGQVLVALIVFLSNLLLSTGLVLAFFHPTFLGFFLLCFLLKSIPDFIILYAGAGFFKQRGLLVYFPFMSLFYYFYLSVSAALAILGAYSWKNRKQSRYTPKSKELEK